MDINKEIGKKIRAYRKAQGLSLADLADKIYKNTSTMSKYENGHISVDIQTLYDIADALDVDLTKLLYIREDQLVDQRDASIPIFFKNRARLYGYFYDGRSKEIVPIVINISHKIEDNKYQCHLYMNYQDLDFYQVCENTYTGYVEHFDAKSNIILTNNDTPMEKATLQILATFLDSDQKWALWTGFSSRPMMPVAVKFLITKDPLGISKDLEERLKISKEDIQYLKLYNMLSVL